MAFMLFVNLNRECPPFGPPKGFEALLALPGFEPRPKTPTCVLDPRDR